MLHVRLVSLDYVAERQHEIERISIIIPGIDGLRDFPQALRPTHATIHLPVGAMLAGLYLRILERILNVRDEAEREEGRRFRGLGREKRIEELARRIAAGERIGFGCARAHIVLILR